MVLKMIFSQTLCRTIGHGRGTISTKQVIHQRRCIGEVIHSRVPAGRRSGRKAGLIFTVVLTGICFHHLGYPSSVEAEEVPGLANVKFEQARRKSTSTEDNRSLISSQHLQVRKSWENPGVYAWGSNVGRVVGPDTDEAVIKTPRRIPYFDGKLTRDIKLDKNFGAAITESGDLVQWGLGYSPDSRGPTPTLTGKDLVKITLSRDRIIALSMSGKVYSIPVSQADQDQGFKPSASSWFPLWNRKSTISYRAIESNNMSWFEKFSDISSGLEHCLMLTSAGRLFSFASGTEDFPNKGQLGIPGLTWNTRPQGRFDQPHEIDALKGFEIKKIAAGDYHSIALDSQGRIFVFGDNSVGQLGFDYSSESSTIDAPSLLPMDKLYQGTKMLPKVTHIAAGGVNSFFTIDATRIAGQGEKDPRNLGRTTADTWSCGHGRRGALGTGKWTHIQGVPTKINALSGLFEYDEEKKLVIPIRLSHLSVSSSHVAAIMSNVTRIGATAKSSENDTNWGADVLWWGGNEYYQVGTGKRNNIPNPTYIAPLDAEADKQMGRNKDHRFQITPRGNAKVGGRWVSMEQRIECGRDCTAVYSGT